MNHLKNPQCTFCAEMNHYVDLNQRDRSFYQLKPYTNYQDRPLLYCYDMTKRPIQDNYITYCNIATNIPGDNEPQYVQVIDSNACRGMGNFCVSSNRDNSLPSNQGGGKVMLFHERKENDCGIALCTCNDFLNSNLQNKVIYDALPGREFDRQNNNKVTVVPQLNLNRDSIDSHGKSIDDQPENSIYSNASILSDPMCRFCHLSKNTQSDQLISPCYCCGTLKYVHQSCLKTWLEVSKKQRENSGNKPPHCELCNFKYIRKRKFQFGKIRQPKLSQNDCALHLIFLCSLLVMVTSASVTILCFAMEKSGSKGNRVQISEKSSDGTLKYLDRKSSIDLSKNRDILCEYISNINLRNYTHLPSPSASKLSAICQSMLKQQRKANRVNSKSTDNLLLSESPVALPKLITTGNSIIWKKETYQKSFGGSGTGNGGARLWILTPEEAVTLASGVIFFIAFFIAMMVQVKSSYTCYQLVMQWIRLNYTNEVQSLQLSPKKNSTNIELKLIKTGTAGKSVSTLPREYIERCITEI